ncbi:hypothetical protein NQ317_012573, partial [Molorchus minor]
MCVLPKPLYTNTDKIKLLFSLEDRLYILIKGRVGERSGVEGSRQRKIRNKIETRLEKKRPLAAKRDNLVY